MVRDCGLSSLGQGPGRYMSFGAYPQPDGAFALGSGVWHKGVSSALDVSGITEDATHAWLSDLAGPRHPQEGITLPDMDKPAAYTWNKAPRLAGDVVETGAIARQLASKHPLVVDAVTRHGGTVFTRVLARLLELARVVPLMEQWLQELRPTKPIACPPRPLRKVWAWA